MPRIRITAVPITLGALALLATACAGGGSSQPAAPVTTAAPAPSATSVALAGSPIGTLLVDGSGRTLYLFEADTTGASTCYDACAAAWPPLLTSAPPVGVADVAAVDLGTTARRDGTQQVTYHGHPLYLFTGDRKAGDTNGQDVEAFGAEWYAVGADGSSIGGT
jgi:predicted lipoprotein with Yx(FWY)xxD motif